MFNTWLPLIYVPKFGKFSWGNLKLLIFFEICSV